MREVCPICGNKLTVEYNYNGCTHEEYSLICDKCHFFEKGWCGIYRMGVGDEGITWSNLHPPTKEEKKRFERKMWRYRKSLLRKRKIKGRGNMKDLWKR